MARKPNYRFERAERERLQAERQARRDLRKARSHGNAASGSEQPAHETTDAKPDNDLPERRDG
jgi:hypothetical protein